MMTKRWVRKLSVAFLISSLILPLSAMPLTGHQAERATNEHLQSIRKYIKQSWRTLSRSNARLADAAIDPKLHLPADAKYPVYVSRKEDIRRVEKRLASEMAATDLARIVLRPLPDDEKAAYLLEHPTLSDRTWTDKPRLKGEKRDAFIRRILVR